MIISTMNFKGGAGKTMIATNLAVAFAQKGFKVHIIDTDDSGAATKWAGRRNDQDFTPSIPISTITDAKTIVNTVRDLNDANDFIIIDGPPRLNALVSKIILLSHLVIIPVPPKSGNDREVTEDFLERFETIQEQRPDGGRTPASLLVNMVKDGYNLHRAFIASLPQLCEDYTVSMFNTQVSDLVAFGESNQFGQGITEYAKGKARNQFNALVKEIETILND